MRSFGAAVKCQLTVVLLLGLLAAGCVADGPRIDRQEGFAPTGGKKTFYVAPFTTIMVPAEIEEGIFDRFVDLLNDRGAEAGYRFVILKGDEAADPQWLSMQHYVAGELFGYLEESGCCSTEIRLRSRIMLHQPGSDRPTLTIDYPREIFFDHDYGTLEAERRRLAEEIAGTLAASLLAALSPP